MPTASNVAPELAGIGVNVAGFLRGGLGLGQAARLYVAALRAAGVPVRTTTFDPRMPDVVAPDGSRAQVKTTDFADLHVEGELPFNLVCVNAPELPEFHSELGAQFFEDRYTIGVWAWEVDVVPASWDRAFALVDEIWTYSRYVADILAPVAPCPVLRMPLPIVAPPAVAAPLPFAVPDGFTFLFLFDFYSTLARKNPLGLIEAFTRAFAPGEGPRLLLKSSNGDFRPDRLARLQAAAGDRPDIQIVDRFLTADEMAALMRRCDCYVSLHRAEGFGLTLGEAMALGTPVIATGWSANLDFMTPENSHLVDHVLSTVGADGENYPADGTWAEPDVDHAAALMREVYERQEAARERAARGQREIAEHFSLDAVGEMARARLKRLARVRRRGGSGPGATDGGLANSWLEIAELKLTHDPLAAAAQAGGARSLVRRATLLAMRPYTYHQDELNAVAVRATREVDGRLDDLTVDSQSEINALKGRIQQLEGALGSLSLQSVRTDLPRVLEGARARPASTHPAISHVDAHGRRALGFSGAASARAQDGYRGFEDIFRGDEAAIRAQQDGYLDAFAGAEWVLDLGCGRGELLDALRERGIGARGVDLDETMVARAREKGHDVALGDAAAHLRTLPDAGVPGIVAAQVVEHLSAGELVELLDLIRAKLAPGAIAILETVNPHNPAALKAFWTDITHHHPLFPEVLLALCRLAGFDEGRVLFPQTTEDFDHDVYSNRDYAVLARTAVV